MSNHVSLNNKTLQALKCFLCYSKDTFKNLKNPFLKQQLHFHISRNKKMNKNRKRKNYCAGKIVKEASKTRS